MTNHVSNKVFFSFQSFSSHLKQTLYIKDLYRGADICCWFKNVSIYQTKCVFQNSPPYKPQKPDKEQLIQELLPQPIRVQIVDLLHTVTISISD